MYSSNTQSKLVVEGLFKSYRSVQVVNDVSLSLTSGKIAGLLGPNGAGKTTLFYMISGLVAADRGKVWIDGKDITALPIHRRAKLGIGYLPQESSIFGKMTVEDNIYCVLEIHYPKSECRDRLEVLLSDFSLGRIRKSFGLQLSGGERRRVEIARSLAANPKFILLDEPFAGVDPISINDSKKIIRQLSEKNIGVIITDHNVRDTLSICDYIYITSRGKVLAEGTPADIMNNDEVKANYLGEQF